MRRAPAWPWVPMSGRASLRPLCYHDIVINVEIEANSTAMAVAHAFGARDKGATCRICGQPALPVVRLCAQCKAALKRVRHDTVSQHMPLARRARVGERARAAAGRNDGEPRGGVGSWRGVRAPIALAAMLAVIGSTGYFIVQQIHAAIPPEPSDSAHANAERVPVTVTVPPAVAKVPDPTVLAPAAGSVGVTGDGAATAPVKRKVATRVVKPAPAPIAVPPPEMRPAPAPAPVVAAVAPPPPAVRPPDRMQLLAQAFAQCPTDGVLARMVCEQKARIQYCDGYWGQASLCPNGAPDRSLSH